MKCLLKISLTILWIVSLCLPTIQVEFTDEEVF